MSKIWDLIKNEKVEWKTVDEVCDIKRGTKITKKIIEENKGEYPVYSSQTTNNGEIGKLNYYMFDGEYVTWTTDGCYAGTFYYRNEKFSATTHCGVLSVKCGQKLLTKFLYYYLTYDSLNLKNSIVGTIPLFTSEMVSWIKIPIPSIDTQNKIVKILDKFNIYVKELERELERRNKQYKYYLNTLLTNKNSNVYKIGEICEIYSGGDVKKENVRKNPDSVYKYPIYSNGIKENSLYGYTNTYKIQDKCITISARGTIGWSCLRNEKFTPIVRLLCVFPKEQIILTEYLKYFLDIIEFNVPDGGIPQLTKPMLEETDVWFPDIKKQIEIIRILDKFDDITNNILIGLPKEIKLRKLQYEYYRNKLLDFPKN